MPVLPLEPFVFPADPFTAGASFTEEIRWWVFHTRPRAEKTLTRALLLRRIAFFLPLWQRHHQMSGRIRTSHLPLFPGYVFVLGDSDARLEALKTNLVARDLLVPDQHELVGDLARIHRLMVAGASLMPQERLQPGTRVVIVRGPLAGLEGEVLRRGKHLKLIVGVHFLQRGASVELEEWMIEPRDNLSTEYRRGA
jgi:transcriptional antiterminator RfaH